MKKAFISAASIPASISPSLLFQSTSCLRVKGIPSLPLQRMVTENELRDIKSPCLSPALPSSSKRGGSNVLCNITIIQATHRQNQTGKKRLYLDHDNARPHYNAQTYDVIGNLKFTVIPQPSNSPDLAPSDFWMFPESKKTLKGQRFSTDAEVQAAVRK
ncbi:hypothetical protein TNCV_366261 [Trichonephila clavipes]|nr:hypothetical protein TNCV_366261 [Trichonephila clavipes]